MRKNYFYVKGSPLNKEIFRESVFGEIKVNIGFSDLENIENEYHDGFSWFWTFGPFFRALKTFLIQK